MTEYKRTIGYGKTKVTSELSPDHPVHRGVLQAQEIMGGFPEHVGHIFIKHGLKPAPRKDHVISGECSQPSQGRSRINIYAGSIEAAVDSYLVESKATRTTLHEIGHSDRLREEQAGAWLGRKPSRKWEEQDADEFATQAIRSHQAEKSRGRPRLTMRQLIDLRRSQQVED